MGLFLVGRPRTEKPTKPQRGETARAVFAGFSGLILRAFFCNENAEFTESLLFGKDQKGLHKRGIHDQGDF